MNMLVRPSPMPEELDRGYLGRVMRINGFLTEQDAMTDMVRMFKLEHISKRELSFLEPLSLMAGLPLEEFSLCHSTLPIRRAIASLLPDLPHGSSQRRSILFHSGMVATRPGAYFCAGCVSADLAFHGISYWRRDHQFPGQLWCPKHLTPFNYVGNEAAAFLQAPSSYLSQSETVPQDHVDEAMDNACVRRFFDIAAGLIVRPNPLDVRNVAKALREQAASSGLETNGRRATKALLSDLVLDSFPRRWVCSVLPPLENKIAGQMLNQVDGVLHMHQMASTVWAYILAAAVLYETADEALNALIDSNVVFSEKRKCKTQERPKIETKRLVAVYAQCKGRYAAFAQQMELPHDLVVTMLDSCRLPDLTGIQGDAKVILEATDAFFRQRRSIGEIATSGGLTPIQLENVVRCHGPNLKSALLAMASLKVFETRKGIKSLSKVLMPPDADVISDIVAHAPTLARASSRVRVTQIRETEPQN